MTDKERNDYFYVCALIEYIARKTKNHRGDVVKKIGEEGIKKLLQDAEVNHCLSFEQVSDEVIDYYKEKLHIKAVADRVELVEAGSLSGGNQQKIVLGKWLAIKPDVLILDEPTRGVDVNAKFEIINELAKAGIAVIMVSSELPEIINMCDNVCVIKAGKMTGMLGREELDQERIMQYAAGGEE